MPEKNADASSGGNFAIDKMLRGSEGTVACIAFHPNPSVPLLASGSRNQFIKLYDLSAMRDSGQARELSTIRYFDGFLGARIGPVTCLAIHPQKVLLGVGATDSVVSIYSA